jgi:acyl-[acyl-carrier-protein]-phospholipid O-acyltransferase/long-chain-fatty-acid--[acyl-carrier-protein] ligase
MIGIAKLLLRCLLRLLYRVEVRGMEHYAMAGPRVLIIANHSSLLDGVLLYAWLPETPTFAINTQIASRRLFRPFLGFVDLFSMDPTSPLSVKSMIRFIQQDRKAVVFPEGRITVTGIPMKVYEGPGLVADKAEASILPIAIGGAQRSPFSYMKGRMRISWFPKITMNVLPPRNLRLPSTLHGHLRRKAAGREMQKLLLDMYYCTWDFRRALFPALLDAAAQHGWQFPVLEDVNRQPLTYRQLVTRAMVLAEVIADHGSRRDRAGVMLPNVLATPVLFLALHVLGRVPAMLNFTAGPQAILAACRTGRVAIVYTSRKFIESARLEAVIAELEAELRIIYLEDLRAGVKLPHKLRGLLRARMPGATFRSRNPDSAPDDPAVILFTSGSEGSPKGVVLSHANLLSNYAQVRCLIDFRSGDLLFSCLPLFHSFGLNGCLLMPLLGGSRIFLYPTPLHYRIIPELIYELGATILFGASTFLKGYAHHAHEFDFRSLRYVVAGAEKLAEDTQSMWMERFGIRILQGYGVTEASPVIACNTPIAGKAGTVGRLMPDMDCYIAPVPGIAGGGRLVVRGPNIMLGYLVDGGTDILPPATEHGAGWYDTGDIAAIDDEGFVTILGRAKRFAKIGGEMISLMVVEEIAQQAWPGFNHAAVALADERKGEKIILVTDNPDADRRQLQDCARRLKYGELFVPRKVLPTEELPVLGTGKTDYISLARLAAAADEEGDGWIQRIGRMVGKPNEGAGEA